MEYDEGENEVEFRVDMIDVSGIPPSSLANAGLLIAEMRIDGREIAAVNLVVNVRKQGDKIVREILSPLE